VTVASDLDSLSLVPPGRLGPLLTDARLASGSTLDDLAAVTLGRFDAATLADVEAGRRLLGDDDAGLVATVYGLRTEAGITPRRTRLSIDGDSGVLRIGDFRRLTPIGRGGGLVDDVLARYLGLVLTLRGVAPGTRIGVRRDDLETLADALWLELDEVDERLEALMANPRDRVGRRARRLGRRLVVPSAGIMVAATDEGTLVLDPQGEGPDGGRTATITEVGATIVSLHLAVEDSRDLARTA
jgi:hypothetical protein